VTERVLALNYPDTSTKIQKGDGIQSPEPDDVNGSIPFFDTSLLMIMVVSCIEYEVAFGQGVSGAEGEKRVFLE